VSQFDVELPGGGVLELQDSAEVDLWVTTSARYISDYALVKQNDLVLLGAILSQNLAMFRAQRDLIDPKKASAAQNIIIKAASEIRELEKALGIDKKTREAGGQHTVSNYIATLKRAGHEKGVHIAHRIKAYEAFVMELRWRVRLLRNGDDEDRRYHGILNDERESSSSSGPSEKQARGELEEYREFDKKLTPAVSAGGEKLKNARHAGEAARRCTSSSSAATDLEQGELLCEKLWFLGLGVDRAQLAPPASTPRTLLLVRQAARRLHKRGSFAIAP
jgi:hypothetical protein